MPKRTDVIKDYQINLLSVLDGIDSLKQSLERLLLISAGADIGVDKVEMADELVEVIAEADDLSLAIEDGIRKELGE
jgi:hypothetical protein